MAKKDARAERLSKICAEINQGPFGGENKDAVMWLGSRDVVAVQRFPTGCLDLDEALGGGWPKGRFVEIFGPESGGKTTLILHAVANHQRQYPDEDCGLIDTEFSFDEVYAASLGVVTKYLIVNQPDSGEQALNILKQLLQKGVSCVVVDSVAALTTKAELEGDIGDIHVGEQARLMSQSLRQLAAEAGKRNATVFWTNQIREKIGITYGNRETTPAGRALLHYASIRLYIRAIGTVKETVGGKEVIVSSRNKAEAKKNKTAPPFRFAEFCIAFGRGIDTIAATLDSAIALKIIEKRGSWFSLDGQQLGQGRMACLDLLRKTPDLYKQLEEKVVAAKAAGVQPETPPDEAPVEEKVDPDSIEAGDTGDTGEAGEAEQEGAEVKDA